MRRRRRLAPALVLIVSLIAAGAVVAGLVTKESNTLRLQDVVHEQVDDTVRTLQEMIRQNTR